MKRTFIQTKQFTERWDSLKLTDYELRELESLIIDHPELGKIVKGTGGLRKIRLSINNRGKSAGARVCYVDFVDLETVYLVTVYSKKEKSNLTNKEKSEIKSLINQLKEALK